VDLLVVKETTARPFNRAVEVRKLISRTQGTTPVDLLVMTPSEANSVRIGATLSSARFSMREHSSMLPDPNVVAEWFRIAAADLDSAEGLLETERYHGVGLFLQQAVEKIPKGYLISRGWKLEKTHDLLSLFNEAVAREQVLDHHRDVCEALSTQYMAGRYPGWAEAEAGIQEATGLLQQVRALEKELRRLASV
jgi:HEPN domain-containing protein